MLGHYVVSGSMAYLNGEGSRQIALPLDFFFLIIIRCLHRKLRCKLYKFCKDFRVVGILEFVTRCGTFSCDLQD